MYTSPINSGLDASPVPTTKIDLPEGESIGSVIWWLVLIAFIGLAVRLLLFVLGPAVDMDRAYYPESARVVELGHNFVAHGAFAATASTDERIHVPLATLQHELGEGREPTKNGLFSEFYAMPGYPAMLAALEFLRLPMHALLLIQCIISILSVLLVFGIGHAILDSPRAALLGALVVALHPADIMVPTAIIGDTLLVGLTLTGIWLIASKKSRNVWHSAVGGFMLGLASLFSAVVVLLGPLLALWIVLTDFKWRAAGCAVVMALLSLTPPALWMLRNQQAGFGFRLTSATYIDQYFPTLVAMNRADLPDHDAGPINPTELIPLLESERKTGEDVYSTMARLTVDRITSEPGVYARVVQQSALQFVVGHSMVGMYRQLGLTYDSPAMPDRFLTGDWTLSSGNAITSSLATAWSGLNALLLIGTIAGASLLLWRRQWAAAMLLVGLLLYFLVAAAPNGSERMRLPVLGIQAIVIAATFAPAPIRAPKPKKKKFKRRMAESFDKAPTPAVVASNTTGRPI